MWWLPLPEGDMSSLRPGRMLLLNGKKESGALTRQNVVFFFLLAWSAELCINGISCVFQPLMCDCKKNAVNFLQEKKSSDSLSQSLFYQTVRRKTGDLGLIYNAFKMRAPQTWGSEVFPAAGWVEGAYFSQMSLSHVLSVTQAEARVEDWQTFQFAANLNSFPSPSSSFSLILVPSETLLLPPAPRVPQEEAKLRGKRGKAYPFIQPNFLRLGTK